MARGSRTPTDDEEGPKREVGRRLLVLRLGLDRSQEFMSELIGRKNTSWQNYEKGYRWLHPFDARKLAEAVSITMDWLYRGNIRDLSRETLEIIRKGEIKAVAKEAEDKSRGKNKK